MDKTEYKPIDCSIHDQLEAFATLRKKIRISYIINENKKKNTDGVIVDIYSSNKEEFLKLDNGDVIRLDKIISINLKLG